MSELSCENCKHFDLEKCRRLDEIEAGVDSRDRLCGHSTATDLYARAHQCASDRLIASICKHYEERVELCGAIAPCIQCFPCIKPKGHKGLHAANSIAPMEWGKRLAESCGPVSPIEPHVSCIWVKGHSGKHEGYKETTDGKTHLTDWSDPIPAAFDAEPCPTCQAARTVMDKIKEPWLAWARIQELRKIFGNI